MAEKKKKSFFSSLFDFSSAGAGTGQTAVEEAFEEQTKVDRQGRIIKKKKKKKKNG